MRFFIDLKDIQHINTLSFDIDLSKNGICAVVGKNGAGKTTLARAIRNLINADTFHSTASAGIFRESSKITYSLGDQSRVFTFDSKIGTLNCRQALPSHWRTMVAVELSIPSGDRFNFFKSLSEADSEIRKALILENFIKPIELIEFLKNIYPESEFDSLVEVNIRKNTFYCIQKENNRYIREDYFSSGEYFIINLYKKIRKQRKLIFIDEIDISLDASAQVRLIAELRRLCKLYQSNVIFTTHSLAMIRTLEFHELHYLSTSNKVATITPKSFGYINSILYGFRGWDKYILTEDDVLKEFLDYIISMYCKDIFFTYLIIYVGGGSNVADMLRRNKEERFLSAPANVIAILDGDQRGYRHAKKEGIHCIPLESVEKALFTDYQEAKFPYRILDESIINNDPKKLFKALIDAKLMSRTRIYEFLCEKHKSEIIVFAKILSDFLS